MVSKHLSKVNFLRNFFVCGLLAIFILVTTVDKCVGMLPVIPTNNELITPERKWENIGVPPPPACEFRNNCQTKYSDHIIGEIKAKRVFFSYRYIRPFHPRHPTVFNVQLVIADSQRRPPVGNNNNGLVPH